MKLNRNDNAAQLLLTTCRLEVTYPDGIGHGTGFVFTKIIAENQDGTSRSFPLLITNRHVLEGGTGLKTWVHVEANESAIEAGYELTVTELQKFCFYHPNSNIDLAAVPFGPLANAAKGTGREPAFCALDESLVPSPAELDDLSAIEDILLIGYPDGRWDEHNNLPVVRRGITATPVSVDYEGRPEFLIDCACFRGSSGSPVLLYNIGSYSSKGTTIIGNRVKFLGVLHSGHISKGEGDVKVIPIPTSTKVVAEFEQGLHLGVIVRAQHVVELWEHVHNLTQK
jgi:hypothetical protein